MKEGKDPKGWVRDTHTHTHTHTQVMGQTGGLPDREVRGGAGEEREGGGGRQTHT